ncbi:MAG TPA: thioesterase family protein [Marmoricola sp.]|nr:thioesterase family protein [Marmoricola sp.]
MDYEFDRAVAVTPTGEGEYAAELDPGWIVGGGLNGGYLLAVIGTAIRAEVGASGQVDPVSVSSYYLSPSVPGPALVRVRTIRVGGRRTTVAASLVQQQDGQEVERITALAVYGTLEPDVSVDRQMTPPDLPPIEACVDSRMAPEEVRRVAPLLERFGTRLDPAHVGWAVGKPSGEGVIQGWFRLVDDRPLDPVALLMVVDALPPVTFDLGLPGWAPTLELTVHVRARPAPGWAVVRHATRNVSGGHFEEDCEVWDSTGTLVAQSRQLALLPRGT